MATVREDQQRLIRAAIVKDAGEIELYCHSSAKEIKRARGLYEDSGHFPFEQISMPSSKQGYRILTVL
jgi:hypothetical protein